MTRRARRMFVGQAPAGDMVSGERLTPARFRRLSSDQKIEAMVEWFGENFEDPAERISYDSGEGGYQWAGYGPHDANESLQDEFGGLVIPGRY